MVVFVAIAVLAVAEVETFAVVTVVVLVVLEAVVMAVVGGGVGGCANTIRRREQRQHGSIVKTL